MDSRRTVLAVVVALVVIGLFCIPPSYAAGLKKVVAVSRFENKTAFAEGGQFHLDTGMADQLTDALIQSGQFTVLERETLSDVVGEQDMAVSGRFQKSDSARTGKLTSAQILIKGTVTEFEHQTSGSGSGIGFGGFKIGSQKENAHVGLIIRLIDTTTGEVLASERVEGTAASGGFKFGMDVSGVSFGTDSFKKTPLGKATQIAIDNAVHFIAAQLKNKPFQGRVVKYDGSSVYISAGANSGASVGDAFTVFSVGEELIDPSTGEILGVQEKQIGSLKVTQVSEKYSVASIVSGGKGIKSGDIIRQQ
jgi:curli biogenesis system outer membrane secretion channel CsgG